MSIECSRCGESPVTALVNWECNCGNARLYGVCIDLAKGCSEAHRAGQEEMHPVLWDCYDALFGEYERNAESLARLEKQLIELLPDARSGNEVNDGSE